MILKTLVTGKEMIRLHNVLKKLFKKCLFFREWKFSYKLIEKIIKKYRR